MKISTPNAYDVIIIGAGHNGLAAAALLARQGRKVIVCERRSIIGGLGAGEGGQLSNPPLEAGLELSARRNTDDSGGVLRRVSHRHRDQRRNFGGDPREGRAARLQSTGTGYRETRRLVRDEKRAAPACGPAR